eukprot:1142050-Pelagomonas_calceolata.AAC.5
MHTTPEEAPEKKIHSNNVHPQAKHKMYATQQGMGISLALEDGFKGMTRGMALHKISVDCKGNGECCRSVVIATSCMKGSVHVHAWETDGYR